MSRDKEVVPIEQITKYCQNHPEINKLSLFGSVLSNSLSPSSDIDLLVEFEPGQTWGVTNWSKPHNFLL